MTQQSTHPTLRPRHILAGAFGLLALSLVPGCLVLSGKPVQEKGEYCNDDSHCAEGLECRGSSCEEIGACSYSGDCQQGQGCRKDAGESLGQCVDAECSDEDASACAPYACNTSEDVCYQGCDQYSGGCARGYTCDTLANECEPVDCGDYSTDDDGDCLSSCYEDADCSGDNTCAPWGECGIHEDCGDFQPAQGGGCHITCYDNSLCSGSATCTYEGICAGLTVADCGPYQKNEDGTCKVSCGLGVDCIEGFACNGSCVKQCFAPTDCGSGEGCNDDGYCTSVCADSFDCHPNQRCDSFSGLCE